MRCIILLAVLCLVGLAYSNPMPDDLAKNAAEAQALLAVDLIGNDHENESGRQARGFGGFGGGYGGGWGGGYGGGWGGGNGGGWGGGFRRGWGGGWGGGYRRRWGGGWGGGFYG